ncbi:hypothetical protein [Thomasclavelia sp.]
MKNKKLIIMFGLLICIGITICFFNKSNSFNNLEERENCRYCILSRYKIIGKIENLELKKKYSMNVKDLVWDVEVDEDSISDSEYDKDMIDDCLSKLFSDVRYEVKIEDQDIVEFKNNSFIPKNKGTTTAKIRIIVDMEEKYKCGPPPFIEETSNITVN